MKTRDIQDVVIVGAGPAGGSAAMILGRCMRKVVLIDTVPETKAKPESERFVSFKGAVTPEFARVGRHQLRPYETVTCLHTLVDSVERSATGCWRRTTPIWPCNRPDSHALTLPAESCQPPVALHDGGDERFPANQIDRW